MRNETYFQWKFKGIDEKKEAFESIIGYAEIKQELMDRLIDSKSSWPNIMTIVQNYPNIDDTIYL